MLRTKEPDGLLHASWSLCRAQHLATPTIRKKTSPSAQQKLNLWHYPGCLARALWTQQPCDKYRRQHTSEISETNSSTHVSAAGINRGRVRLPIFYRMGSIVKQDLADKSTCGMTRLTSPPVKQSWEALSENPSITWEQKLFLFQTWPMRPASLKCRAITQQPFTWPKMGPRQPSARDTRQRRPCGYIRCWKIRFTYMLPMRCQQTASPNVLWASNLPPDHGWLS